MRPITVKLYTRLKAAILFICLLAFAIPQFAPAAYLRSITITKANSAAQSTLTPGTANLTADGTTTQVLTVTVKDANAKNMTSGGADIAITKFSGTGTISSVTDNGNGTYTAIITSPTAIGSGIFVATLAGEAVKGGTDSQTEVTVTYIPRITAAATTTAQSLTVGTAMTSFTPLTAAGGTTPYVYSYTGTMPIGLSFRASTGAVTGTPTAAQSAANLVFSVHDANNNVASTTSTVSFTVNGSTTATATTTAQSLTVGTAMTSFTPLTAAGGTTPYVYSYTGTMPIGLSFRASTGAVTGTPTAAQSAANLVFSVHDANNNVASTTSTVSFTVNGSTTATATTTAQSLTVGTAMTSFTPLSPAGGTTPYVYSYTGTLPTGLSFSASTGAVTGTPTAAQSAANLVFSVHDANNNVASTTSTVSFTVNGSTTATATTTAQSLTVGTAMTSFTPLSPAGGTTPYVYSYTGTLPTGLSFSASTGAVTGTPTAAQSAANLVFSVHDANNNVASTTSTVSFTVNSPLAFGDSYSGGKVAYILVEGDPGYDPSVQHGLIAATADQSETTPYQAGGTGRPWAVSLNYSVPLLNTFSAIGTGSANTNEIIKANGANSTYAAGLCADYTVTESGIVYSDWYLPSLDELIKISPIITTPQYQPYYYWSSTQKANDEAFCVNPGQASLNYWYKRESCRVRAVRAF